MGVWQGIKKEAKKAIKERLDFMWWMLTSRWYWVSVIILTFVLVWFEAKK